MGATTHEVSCIGKARNHPDRRRFARSVGAKQAVHLAFRHAKRNAIDRQHIAAGMLDALTGTLEGGRPLVSVTVGAWAAESEVADMLRDRLKQVSRPITKKSEPDAGSVDKS